MIQLLLIAPYQAFADFFIEIFREHSESGESSYYDGEEYNLSTAVAAGIEELRSLDFDADVVVSRGFVATDLRHLNYYIPLVEVPVASADLVHSLQRAREEYGCDRVAVIGSRNMVMGGERLERIFSMEIQQYIIGSRKEIRRTVDRIAAEGIPVVVGGVSTCIYARECGIGAVLLESRRESIWHSITEAKRLAYIVRKEKERSQHLDVLVNQTQDGIITLDSEDRITLFNKTAARIFSLNIGRVMGKQIQTVLPTLTITPQKCYLEQSSNDSGTVHEVFRHADRNISATITNIYLRGEPYSRLITVQDVTRIQKLETQIRQRIYSRGHIARHTFEDIIGRSSILKETIAMAKKFSHVDSNVLIFGKTGTGKELFAQSIHNYSLRRDEAFVAVNCAALSEDLLESELFGYTAGAFTGASRGGKLGLFELAHRGTLFLDEISEIPIRLQGRLLRAIQEKEIRRLGHDRVIPVDVRLIAASNRVIEQQVTLGLFREDLFYRINILKLDLPDLETCSEDIPALVEHWVEQYCRQFRISPMTVSEKAKGILQSMPWPGNIRQLRNMCERLVVLSQQGLVIDACDVEVLMETSLYPPGDTGSADLLQARAASESGRDVIKAVLKRTGNNRSEAARQLGISRTTLWRRMKQLEHT